jgi:mitochondrial fission protein ELM1
MNFEVDTASQVPQRPRLPLIWLVLGEKQGDNGQAYTIADALGWPYELRRIRVLKPFVFGKPKVGPTLYHIDRDKSDKLEPPWPDLIITVGRRPANVALWIREQSGKHTTVVLVGKPSGMMNEFGLIVASGENQFPPLKNVLNVSLPLMRVDEAGVASAAAKWTDRFATLPRPLIGVLVGGPTNPFVFNQAVIDRLVEVAESITKSGGTAYVTTSRRTPVAVVDQLKDRLPSQAQLFAWEKDATDNPYLGLVGLADGLIVTGDSISMMVEVIRLRKPLAILSLPTSLLGSLDQSRRSMARWLFAPGGKSSAGRLRAGLARLAYRTGFIRHTRDFRAFHEMLVNRGLAVWVGQGFPPPTGQVPDDAALVVRRIKALMNIREE